MTFAKDSWDIALFNVHWFATVVHIMPSCFCIFHLQTLKMQFTFENMPVSIDRLI